MPVPREQLPVVLPLDIRPTGTGNPLAELEEFVKTTCPRCGGPARRETDTLDCHFDALWLWVPVCVPAGGARGDRSRRSSRWPTCATGFPPSALVAGSDSGNFVFDQRIVTKALRDIGPLAFLADGEPFAGCLFHEMVIADGRKMSKHLGNVVDPDELVARYGADTVRLAVLYAARPQQLAELERLGGASLPPLPRRRCGTTPTASSRRRCRSRAGRRRAAPEATASRSRHDRAPQAETRRSGARLPSRRSPRTWRRSRCTARCAT